MYSAVIVVVISIKSRTNQARKVNCGVRRKTTFVIIDVVAIFVRKCWNR